MIDKEQALAICEQFIKEILPEQNWHKSVELHINAIILYGSVAKGTNRPDSDIDILIIMPLAIEEEFTSGEYFYNYKGHEINIVIRSIERIRKIASEKKIKPKERFLETRQL